MKILPIVLHRGHIPVVTFFGPDLIIFWVFRRPIIVENIQKRLLNLDLISEQYKLKNVFFDLNISGSVDSVNFLFVFF